jgi:hypothetical protein
MLDRVEREEVLGRGEVGQEGFCFLFGFSNF